MMEQLAGQPAAYLDSDQTLEAACQELTTVTALGFDSEFMRTNTYFPKPGLFQLNDGRRTSLVDPLAINDWQSFCDLLGQNSLTLVMHSSSEDLGLLRSFLGALPARLFDTQRAAAFLGLGYSLSYQALVNSELGVEVPKGETRSDWLRRPLSATQLEYAALDVKHLLELRDLLGDKLRHRQMLAWFEADCEELLANVPDEMDPVNWERAYQSIGSAWQLDEQALGLLQKLAYWREQEARLRNKPRNWVVKDAELLALAEKLPWRGAISEADIRRSGVFSTTYADREAARLARFLNQELTFGEPATAKLISQPLSNRTRKQLKALQKLGRDKAEQLGISPELLSRKRLWVELLENDSRGRTDIWPPGLNNWRRELLEPGVRAVLAGGAD